MSPNGPAPRTALVVTAHGSPESIEDLPAFLANIRRGRPAPPDVLEEVRRRYVAIGGRSPLTDITERQADALGRALALPARVAMRLWHPSFREVVASLAREGFERLVSVPIAPYSVHVYHAALREAVAAEAPGVPLVEIAPWNQEPSLVAAYVGAIRETLQRTSTGRHTLVLLTAHSLPVRAIEFGDPYATLVQATTDAIAASLGNDVAVRLAFQSQGMTNDAWLGPDLPTAFRDAREARFDTVVVAPIGFLADHVEVLYDLDVEAAEIARSLGLTMHRTRVLNDDPQLVDALANAVRRALGSE